VLGKREMKGEVLFIVISPVINLEDNDQKVYEDKCTRGELEVF